MRSPFTTPRLVVGAKGEAFLYEEGPGGILIWLTTLLLSAGIPLLLSTLSVVLSPGFRHASHAFGLAMAIIHGCVLLPLALLIGDFFCYRRELYKLTPTLAKPLLSQCSLRERHCNFTFVVDPTSSVYGSFCGLGLVSKRTLRNHRVLRQAVRGWQERDSLLQAEARAQGSLLLHRRWA